MSNLVTHKDERSNVTTNTYNAMGFLTHVTDPLGGISYFEYDLAGRLTAKVSPMHYVQGATLPDLPRQTFIYDKMDRLTTKTDTYIAYGTSTWKSIASERLEYDKNGNILKKTDANNNTTNMSYDLANRLVLTTDPVANSTQFAYDGLGRLIRQTDANGVFTDFAYDLAGNILTKTVGGTIVEQNTYNFIGNPTIITDANGNTTVNEYNLLGLLRRANLPGDANIPVYAIDYLYDVNGQLVTKADSLLKERYYTYDNQGRVLSETLQQKGASSGITVNTAYDVKGNLRFHTDGNGNRTEYAFDALDRLTCESLAAGSVVHKTSYEYDKDGNRTKVTDRLNNSITYRYDNIGRLAETVNQLGIVIEKLEYNDLNAQIKSTDALGNATRFKYDSNGRLTATIDPMNNRKSRTYDKVGNVVSETDGNGNITRFVHDRFNRLTTITNPDNSRVTYTYDPNGNLLRKTDGGATESFTYNVRNLATSCTDASENAETYSYRADGSIISKKDRKDITTSFAYDIYGRLLSENAGGDIISYTYDNNDNELSMTDSTGITTRTYDATNRVTSKTVPVFGTTNFTYDITAGLPDGHQADQTQTPDNKIIRRVYDKARRLNQVLDNGTPTATYTYFDNGSQEAVTYPNNVVEEFTYYADNSLKTLSNKQGSQILEAYNYLYDANGNLIQKLDGKGTTTYTYTVMKQLLTVTKPGGKNTTYAYDEGGNRIKETSVSGNVTTTTVSEYDNRSRLVKTNKIVSGSTVTNSAIYSYDNSGNMTGKFSEITKPTQPGDSLSLGLCLVEDSPMPAAVYTYDARNRLIKVEDGKATVVNTYNGNGQRVSKTTGGSTTHFLYEFDKIILERTGNQDTRNIYGMNLISRENSTAKYHLMYNGHRGVTQLVSNGVSVASYYYDDWGSVTEETGGQLARNNPFRYSSYYYDAELGIYDLKARFYDPEIARFLQEDTFRGNPRDALSLNRYTYVHNNPLIYYDPTGHAKLATHPTVQANKDRKNKVYTTLSDGTMVQIAGMTITNTGSGYNNITIQEMYLSNGQTATINSNMTVNNFYNNGTVNNNSSINTIYMGNGSTLNNNSGGTVNTINVNNGVTANVNNSGTIKNPINVGNNSTLNLANSGNGTVGNNILGGVISGNNSNINVNISGGSVGYMDARNSNVLVVKTGGTLGPVHSYDANGGLMHSVMYNNYAPGASILAISSNPNTALNLANNALGSMSGSGKATGQMFSGNSLQFTSNSPFSLVLERIVNSPVGQKAGQLIFDIATVFIGTYFIYDSLTNTYHDPATGKVVEGGSTVIPGTDTITKWALDDVMNNPIYKEIPGIDCSEIAEDLYRVNNKGVIYNIVPTIEGMLKLNVYTYGVIQPVDYHHVYGYAGSIYDPRYSVSPVSKDVYFSDLHTINPLGFHVFELRLR